MYRLLAFVLMIVLAGAAYAGDTGNSATPGVKGPVVQNPWTPDGREGGEDIGTAFVIGSLPFTDGGATCDNINDYDEVCPYSGSTSADVVYSFTPGADDQITLDLCSEGNQYDTKLYMYQDMHTPGAPWACNDDFCSNSYTYYASRLEGIAVYAGHTYYIVIDGYGGGCGNYELSVTGYEPCIVTCPDDAVPEGEPPLVDYYVDNYNGGCNSTPPVFQHINWVNEDMCAWMCGVSGWYYAGGSYRDTDWFPVLASGYQIDMTVTSEYPTNIYFLTVDYNCVNVSVVANATTVPCVPTTLSYATSPGQEWWLWVGPSDFSGPVNEYTYFMHVCGILYDIVPVENASWGTVKDLYR